MKNHLKKNFWIIIPFIISIMLFGFLLICSQIFPAGDRLGFYWDGFEQYIPFISYYRQAFLSFDFGFSSIAHFGMDFTALFTYYLASPFNILLFIFPQSMITEAGLFVILVKIGSAAVTFALFSHIQLKASRFTSTLFSIAYSLMSWIISYFVNLMWLDAIIWLPMVCLGIHKLIEKDQKLLLIFSLTIAIISNFYTGYMICLFSTLYFIYAIVTSPQLNSIKKYISKGIKFGVSGLLSAGMSLFLILPTYLFLKQNTNVVQSKMPLFGFQFKSFLDSFLPLFNSSNQYAYNDFIKIFVSVFAFVLALTFFINHKVHINKRVAGLILLFILFLSMQISTFDYIWHLMHFPVGYPYRESFLVSFIILIFAVQSFEGIKKNDSQTVKSYYIATAIIFLFLLFYNGLTERGLVANNYLFNFILLSVWGVMVYIFTKFTSRYSKIIIRILIIIVICIEMFINGSVLFDSFNFNSRNDFREKQNIINDIKKSITSRDNGDYRLGDSNALTANDNMTFYYPSVTHNSSTENLFVNEFLHSLGYSTNGTIYRTFYSQSIVIDSILGIKYSIPLNFDNTAYETHQTTSGIQYQENPYALPFIFVSDRSLNKNEVNNMFDAQKLLLDSISSDNQSIYLLEGQLKGQTLNFLSKATGPVYFNSPRGHYNYVFQLAGQQPLYFKNPDVPSNRAMDPYKDLEIPVPILLGFAQKGDLISITFDDISALKLDEVILQQVDLKNFEKVMSEIKSKTISFNRPSRNEYIATVNASKNDFLHITIPYSEGWELYIDNQKTPIKKDMSVFMGADIESGMHEIKLIYHTPALKLGIIISVLSFIVSAFWIIYSNIKQKNM